MYNGEREEKEGSSGFLGTWIEKKIRLLDMWGLEFYVEGLGKQYRGCRGQGQEGAVTDLKGINVDTVHQGNYT